MNRINIRRIAEISGSLLFVGMITVLYLLPLAVWLLTGSFRGGNLSSAGLLYRALFRETVTVSMMVALVSLICGAGTAIFYAFCNTLWRRLITSLMTIPLMVGFLARNYSWLGLLSYLSGSERDHWVNWLGDILLYRTSGVVIVMATVFIPFVYFVVLQGVNSLRATYFEAARTLGASDQRIFFTITLSILSRSLVSAFFIAVVLAVGYFVTPAMIGGGQHDFIGNGVLTLLHTLGDVRGASVLTLYLFLTALVPVLGVTLFTLKRRRLLRGSY